MENTQFHIERACEIMGGQAALALALGVHPSMPSQWVTGRKPVSAERCIDIERATKGVVRCEDLRPDVNWSVIRNSKTKRVA